MFFRTEWSDYFPSTSTYNLKSQTFTSREVLSNSDVYVSHCLFKSILSTSIGGALYLSSTTNFLVESTSFFSCKTSSNGGAIYFSNSGSGQSVFYGVCGYDCCSTSTGNSNYQFACTYVKDATSSKNYVNYSSIVRCVSESSGSWYNLALHNGNICCPSANISLNKCHYRSGILCQPVSDSNSVTCSFKYSSIADNIANGYTCMSLWISGAKYEIRSCNILRNTQGTSTQGIIFTQGILTICDSCILNNIGTCIFHQGSTYSITLSNCTVDLTSNNGYLTTQNTVTKSFILALNHMSTLNCYTEYDAIGTLTPITRPPSSLKQLNCCTCGHHSPLRDFFSLSCILIFNFIHMEPSN
jgi:hypothetical protein